MSACWCEGKQTKMSFPEREFKVYSVYSDSRSKSDFSTTHGKDTEFSVYPFPENSELFSKVVEVGNIMMHTRSEHTPLIFSISPLVATVQCAMVTYHGRGFWNLEVELKFHPEKDTLLLHILSATLIPYIEFRNTCLKELVSATDMPSDLCKIIRDYLVSEGPGSSMFGYDPSQSPKSITFSGGKKFHYTF